MLLYDSTEELDVIGDDSVQELDNIGDDSVD